MLVNTLTMWLHAHAQLFEHMQRSYTHSALRAHMVSCQHLDRCHGVSSKQLVPLVLYNAQLVKVAHITRQVGIYHQFHSAVASPSPYNCADSSSAKLDCIPTRRMSLFTASEILQLKSASCAHLPTDSLPAGAVATTLLQVLWLQSLQGLHRRWPLRCLCCRTS